jgi:hypothetical protein
MPGRTKGASTTWHEAGGNFEPALRIMRDARKQGQDFDSAWPMAIEAVKRDDRNALRETTAAWRAEYERRNSYGGNLMSAAGMALDLDAA